MKLGIFVVFGSLMTFSSLLSDSWAAVGILAVTLLVARPLCVSLIERPPGIGGGRSSPAEATGWCACGIPGSSATPAASSATTAVW
ncbi:MAG: hypothetical protein WBP81_23110 [Solirubrobacteraceae bacterium]